MFKSVKKSLAKVWSRIAAFFLVLGIVVSGILVGRASVASIVKAAAVDWDKSTLSFNTDFGCKSGTCENPVIQAEVCNGGQPMAGTSTYEVWFAVSGNPKSGAVVFTGTINALGTNECQTFTYNTNGVAGNYMFRALQRPGHPGQGDLWSNQCTIGVCQQATATPNDGEPTATPTATPVATDEPTEAPRATPTLSPAGPPAPANATTPTQGQVLGASTLGGTGTAKENLSMGLIELGAIVAVSSLYEFAKSSFRSR